MKKKRDMRNVPVHARVRKPVAPPGYIIGKTEYDRDPQKKMHEELLWEHLEERPERKSQDIEAWEKTVPRQKRAK